MNAVIAAGVGIFCLGAVLAAVGLFFLFTRDAGSHSAGPRRSPAAIPPAGNREHARRRPALAWRWRNNGRPALAFFAARVWVTAWAFLLGGRDRGHHTGPAAQDGPQAPQPEPPHQEFMPAPPPPAATAPAEWPAPSLDYELDDNTVWRDLVAITEEYQP